MAGIILLFSVTEDISSSLFVASGSVVSAPLHSRPVFRDGFFLAYDM